MSIPKTSASSQPAKPNSDNWVTSSVKGFINSTEKFDENIKKHTSNWFNNARTQLKKQDDYAQSNLKQIFFGKQNPPATPATP